MPKPRNKRTFQPARVAEDKAAPASAGTVPTSTSDRYPYIFAELKTIVLLTVIMLVVLAVGSYFLPRIF